MNSRAGRGKVEVWGNGEQSESLAGFGSNHLHCGVRFTLLSVKIKELSMNSPLY